MPRPAGPLALHRMLDAYRRLQLHNTHLVHEQGSTLGLNQTDLRLLFFLVAEAPEGILPKAMTRYLGLSTGATTSLIDRLETRGYVQRVPNPDDRRSVYVVISTSGRDAVHTVQKQYLDALAEAIPADRADEFTAQLEALDAALASRTTAATAID